MTDVDFVFVPFEDLHPDADPTIIGGPYSYGTDVFSGTDSLGDC